MKYTSKRFTVGAANSESARRYAENYDRVFGGKSRQDRIAEAIRVIVQQHDSTLRKLAE
jgi:hypothetical protein